MQKGYVHVHVLSIVRYVEMQLFESGVLLPVVLCGRVFLCERQVFGCAAVGQGEGVKMC